MITSAKLRRRLVCLFSGMLLPAGICLFAQLPDGTKTTQQWIDEIVSNIDEEEKPEYNVASVYNSAHLSIMAYIIRDIDGSLNCDEADITAGINLLNEYFSKINTDFTLRSVQVVDDYHYSTIQNETDTRELLKKHKAERTINLYLLESIETDSVPCYGYTYYPSDTVNNTVFLDKDYIHGNYLITLMGHFFGLLSTHDTLGGFEYVNGVNCRTSGDFICDTWADPNLFDMVDDDCIYSGTFQDGNGEFYVPTVANLMSESKDACKCIFTSQQYRRMLFCLKKYRYYLF